MDKLNYTIWRRIYIHEQTQVSNVEEHLHLWTKWTVNHGGGSTPVVNSTTRYGGGSTPTDRAGLLFCSLEGAEQKPPLMNYQSPSLI